MDCIAPRFEQVSLNFIEDLLGHGIEQYIELCSCARKEFAWEYQLGITTVVLSALQGQFTTWPHRRQGKSSNPTHIGVNSDEDGLAS